MIACWIGVRVPRCDPWRAVASAVAAALSLAGASGACTAHDMLDVASTRPADVIQSRLVRVMGDPCVKVWGTAVRCRQRTRAQSRGTACHAKPAPVAARWRLRWHFRRNRSPAHAFRLARYLLRGRCGGAPRRAGVISSMTRLHGSDQVTLSNERRLVSRRCTWAVDPGCGLPAGAAADLLELGEEQV